MAIQPTTAYEPATSAPAQHSAPASDGATRQPITLMAALVPPRLRRLHRGPNRTIDKPSSTSARTGHLRRAARASAVAVVTALLTLTATPADASVGMYGWVFATDVYCDQTVHQVSVTSTAASSTYTPADAGWRVWLRYNGGAWIGPSGWRMWYDRSAYWDGPIHMYTAPGNYSFYIEYALLTTAGWVTVGQFADHRISMGGFTNSGGASSCNI